MRRARPSPRRRLARGASAAVAFVALALSAFADASPGGDAGPAAPRKPSPASPEEASLLREALVELDSPYLATREAAVASLGGLGRTARPALREAFLAAAEPRRATLARALATNADGDDLRLLLDALPVARDPATTAALRDALVEHAEEVAELLAARRANGAKSPPAWDDLEALLLRARLERLFLSRKSLSGGTGSYEGQYAILRPWRKPALELCLAMLAETEVRRPGVFPVGSYRFLRPPPVLVEHEEVREMAANAIAELCTADDTAILQRLLEVHAALEADRARSGEAHRVRRLLATGLDDIVLPTLVSLGRLSPLELELRVQEHEDEGAYDDAAHLRLRMKEFQAAVRLFQRQIRQVRQNVIPNYNLACAYARWAEASADDPATAERLREGAVSALGLSVAYGYADWAWMEQDLDLEAIRKMPGYRRLVDDLKQRFPPPSTWRGASGGATVRPPEPGATAPPTGPTIPTPK